MALREKCSVEEGEVLPPNSLHARKSQTLEQSWRRFFEGGGRREGQEKSLDNYTDHICVLFLCGALGSKPSHISTACTQHGSQTHT